MNLPRIVFAGTPEFACPALSVLLGLGAPVAVLTQPDRPAGRGRKLTPSPVKRLAEASHLPVAQPTTLRSEAARSELASFRPELIITAAYGLLLPPAVLEMPSLGCWNLHASLLPRWRGASPIQQAILAGDHETGISLMQLDPGMDTGPVRLMRSTPIHAQETAGELHDRLAGIAAEVLEDALRQLSAGTLPEPQPQDNALATHAPRITKDDARIEWAAPAEQIARAIRAFHPWPVAWSELFGQPIRIHRAKRTVSDSNDPPGTLLDDALAEDRLVVRCGSDALELLELQAPGRRAVSARDWLNAHPNWRQAAP